MSELSNLYALGEQSPDLPNDADYWIAPDARVIGQVTLNAGSSVWWGSVLRGDNEPTIVGEGSNLQEQCVCHVDPGFPLIIVKNCLIGAHALVTEGSEIPDRILVVGMPAKVKRELSADTVEKLLQSAKKYQWNKEQFKTKLTAL